MSNRTAKGHFFAFLCVLVWGTTFISPKLLLKELTPIEILFIRFALGFAALSVISPRIPKLKDSVSKWLFICAGISGITLYFLLENIALTYTLASNVGTIVSVVPFFTAIISCLVLKNEKLNVNFFIGFVAAITGIAILSYNGVSEFKLNPIGDLLALAAAAAWAVYTVALNAISSRGYGSIETTRFVFMIGLIFMIPALFIMDFSPDIKIILNLDILPKLLYLGFGASALCFVLWSRAVNLIGPLKASMYIYASPVITVITSAAILGEKITPLSAAGVALALIGLIIGEKGRKHEQCKNT